MATVRVPNNQGLNNDADAETSKKTAAPALCGDALHGLDISAQVRTWRMDPDRETSRQGPATPMPRNHPPITKRHDVCSIAVRAGHCAVM